MIVLSQSDVERLLPLNDCIDVMANALGALARGESLVPLRTLMRLPNGKDIFGVMPGYLGAREYDGSVPVIGAKIITVFPGNHGTQFDSHQGAVLLFDAANGALQAVLDATAITSIRTAAVSALATKLLAREDADDLAILGSGVQARTHLEAITLIRDVKRVRVWSRSRRNAEEFCRSAGDGISIQACDTAEEAVRGASIVCTVTSSSEPVLRGEWVADGAHVNVVGAATPRAREVDSAMIARSRLFVDSRLSALNEAGDIMIPLQEEAITPDHIVGEIGEIVAGLRSGRRTAKEITLFKSLGLAVEDIAAAQFAVDAADEQGVGTRIDLGGARHATT